MIVFPARQLLFGFALSCFGRLDTSANFSDLPSIQGKRADGGENTFRSDLISFMKLDTREMPGYRSRKGKTIVRPRFAIFVDSNLQRSFHDPGRFDFGRLGPKCDRNKNRRNDSDQN